MQTKNTNSTSFTLFLQNLLTPALLLCYCLVFNSTLSASEEDPWSRFGLGTSCELVVKYEKQDQPEKLVGIITFRDAEGKRSATILEEDRSRTYIDSPLNWMDTKSLPNHTFKPVTPEKDKESLSIDNKDYTCVIKQWQDSSDEDQTKTITVWICEDLDIPRREMQSPHYNSFLLPANTVKCEWLIEKKKQAFRSLHLITQIDQDAQLNDKTVKTQHEVRKKEIQDDRGIWSTTDHSTCVLSDLVPGHILSIKKIKNSRDSYRRNQESCTITHVTPVERFDAKLAKENIKQGHKPKVTLWNNHPLGTWKVLMNYNNYGTRSENIRYRTIQALALLKDDSVIVENIDWNASKNTNTSYRIERIDDMENSRVFYGLDYAQATAPEIDGFELKQSEEASFLWNNEPTPCKIIDYAKEVDDSIFEIRIYSPLDKVQLDQLQESGISFLQLEVRNKNQHRSSGWTLAVHELNPTINGTSIRGAILRSTAINDNDSERNGYKIISPDTPNWEIGEFTDNNEQNKKYQYLVSFGGINEEPTTPTGVDFTTVHPLIRPTFANCFFYGLTPGQTFTYDLTIKRGDSSTQKKITKHIEANDWLGRSIVHSYVLDEDRKSLFQWYRSDLVNAPAVLGHTAKEKGKETLHISGKDYSCRIVEWTGKVGTEDWTIKEWLCDELSLPYRETQLGDFRLATDKRCLKMEAVMKANTLTIKINRHISETKMINDQNVYIEKWNTKVEGAPKPFHSNGEVWLNPLHPAGIIKSLEHRQPPNVQAEYIEENLIESKSKVIEESSLWPASSLGTSLEYEQTGQYGSMQSQTINITKNSLGALILEEKSGEQYQREVPMARTLPKQPETFLNLIDTKTGSMTWNQETVETISKKYSSTCKRIQIIVTSIANTAIPACPLDLGGLSIELPPGCVKASLQIGSRFGTLRQHRVLKPEKENLEIDGVTYECWVDTLSNERVEMVAGNTPSGEVTTRWLCEKVPGALVKSEKPNPNLPGSGDTDLKPSITRLVSITKPEK